MQEAVSEAVAFQRAAATEEHVAGRRAIERESSCRMRGRTGSRSPRPSAASSLVVSLLFYGLVLILLPRVMRQSGNTS